MNKRKNLELQNDDKISESNDKQSYSKMFACHICNKEYRINFQLKQHIKRVHDRKNKHCSGKSFSGEYVPNSPEGKKDAQFDIKHVLNTNDHINKGFPKDLKRRHLHKIHNKYKCESCSKSFKSKWHLERHLHTVHDGYKDFKCESCGKSFSQAHHMKSHILKFHKGHIENK